MQENNREVKILRNKIKMANLPKDRDAKLEGLSRKNGSLAAD